MKIQHFNVIISISSLHFFLFYESIKQNNEIKTTRATITIIVIKNIEKKNEIIMKISLEIKRFMKRYVALSLYYATFSSSLCYLSNWTDLSL